MLDSTTPLTPPPVRQPRSRKQIVMIISVAVALLVVLGVAVFFGIQALKKDGSSGSVKKTTDIFAPDLTKTSEPASPITIGKARYQSPCRLLPEWSFEAIFGKIEDTASRSENYLYRSPGQPKLALSAYTPQSRCVLHFYRDSSYVVITPTYYTDESYSKQSLLANTPTNKTSERYTSLVALRDKLQSAVAAKEVSASEAKFALDTISRSLDFSQKRMSVIESGDYFGKTIPVENGPGSAVFTVDNNDFDWQEGSALLTLSVPVDRDFKKNTQVKLLSLSAKEIVDVFNRSEKAIEVISKNFTNQSLPQGPAQAYYTNSQPRKLHSPCTLADISLIEKNTALPVSASMSQRSTYHNIDVNRIHTSVKSKEEYSYPVSNVCEINFGTNMTSGAGGTITLEIIYPKDQEYAKKLMTYFSEIFPDATPLSLQASSEGWSAAETCSDKSICSTVHIARKNGTIVRLYILRNSAVALTQEEHVEILQNVLGKI